MDLSEVDKLNNYRHPWELSRRDSLLRILKKNVLTTQYADIGSGDLFFLKSLRYITNKPIYAVDCYYKTIPDIEGAIFLNDLNDIPQKSLDFLLLMDVLEHVQDDHSFLLSFTKKLNDKGRVLITVPAFQFLYSAHDKFLKHYRRYNYNQLTSLLNNNFEIEEAFYFYTTLFFVRFIESALLKFRKKSNSKFGASNWKYSESSIITVIIKKMLDFDFMVNRYLANFLIKIPGLSLCIICRKKSV